MQLEELESQVRDSDEFAELAQIRGLHCFVPRKEIREKHLPVVLRNEFRILLLANNVRQFALRPSRDRREYPVAVVSKVGDFFEC